MHLLSAATLFCTAVAALQNFVIPGWHLQITSKAGTTNLKTLSTPGYNSSSWYEISSRRTVFGGLIEAGVYNTEQLFYSKNLQTTIDYLPYYSPWLYRAEFKLDVGEGKGRHFFLQTNGITSKADVYLNGDKVAGKETQAGCYGGRRYDVTALVRGRNGLVIKAWPTDYNLDFGLGFVDWNPYPPDNGTGVWRDVSIKETGPLLMGPLRIVNDYVPGAKRVEVTLKVNVTNLETSSMSGVLAGAITDESLPDRLLRKMRTDFTLQPMEEKTISVSTVINNPKIWWPKQWGDQPLYTAHASVVAQGVVSDESPKTNFGIRHITSELNGWYDRIFMINGYHFQVRGGGYAPDVFLIWNETKFEAQARYVLDMGMNTIRLEGKEEHPELYDVADRLGLMVMPGWECCDKWEAWSYNDEVTAKLWDDDDYDTADVSMRHEAAMLQTHPSILAFLIGSDYWPDPKAGTIYIDALYDFDWQNPIVCSAAKRGYVEQLGWSGMKMPGPYDWVPPNYWYDGIRYGTAFGFGSELGAGVGTPEIGSLKQFLTLDEMNELWTKPNIGLYHMSTNVSSFHFRTRYNEGLWNRYGAPTSLDDYLLKAQAMDYEATRAQYEAYSANWNALSGNYSRPATGLIYWMLNNAWPSLHWNQFDFYLHPAGSYFGTKVGNRIEHVAYNYVRKSVYIINHSLASKGTRQIDIELIDTAGNLLSTQTVSVETEPNRSKRAVSVEGLNKIQDVAFLRLLLSDPETDTVLSRNVYWLSPEVDELEWNKSTWFYTPVKSWSNLTALNHLATASVDVSVGAGTRGGSVVTLVNEAEVPAFFVRLNLVDDEGNDVVPVVWSDNYVTLWPRETMVLDVTYETSGSAFVEASGWNFGSARTVQLV